MLTRRGKSKIYTMDFVIQGKRYYRTCRTTDRRVARIVEMKAKVAAMEAAVKIF